jgi:hypothetical protein
MTRILIVMFATTVAASTGAEAATPRKSAKPEAWQTAAVAARPMTPARPTWASPNDCFTDDGYGRFTPCGLACGGR